MANEKPKRLFYLGGITRDPNDGLPGIPARDLDEADIALLSDEQIEEALTEPPFAEGSPYRGALYQVSQPTRGGKPVAPAGSQGSEGTTGASGATEPTGPKE
jgi:hypothetical protein